MKLFFSLPPPLPSLSPTSLSLPMGLCWGCCNTGRGRSADLRVIGALMLFIILGNFLGTALSREDIVVQSLKGPSTWASLSQETLIWPYLMSSNFKPAPYACQNIFPNPMVTQYSSSFGMKTFSETFWNINAPHSPVLSCPNAYLAWRH